LTARPRRADSSAADSTLPPAGVGDRRGNRLHPRHGREVPQRRARRVHARACWRRATTPFLSVAAHRAGATWMCPDASRSSTTSISASTGWPRCHSATSPVRPARHRARWWQYRDGLLPFGPSHGGHRREGHRAQRFRGDEGLALGEGGCQHEGIPIINFHVPKSFEHKWQADRHDLRSGAGGLRRQRAAQPGSHRAARRASPCDAVLIAVGQENAFPWIESDCGIQFDKWGLPVLGQGDLPVHRAAGLFWWRRRLRAQEHHHGRRPRP
jgi:hypothetical protein